MLGGCQRNCHRAGDPTHGEPAEESRRNLLDLAALIKRGEDQNEIGRPSGRGSAIARSGLTLNVGRQSTRGWGQDQASEAAKARAVQRKQVGVRSVARCRASGLMDLRCGAIHGVAYT